MQRGYNRPLSREGRDAAVQEAFGETFETHHANENVGRIKDKQYARELATEEDKYRSLDLKSEGLQKGIEKQTEEKILSDMERLADFIILKNKDGKYTQAKNELLRDKDPKEVSRLEQESTHSFESIFARLKSKRQDVKEVEEVPFYSASSVYMNRLKGYQEKKAQDRGEQTQEQNIPPEAVHTPSLEQRDEGLSPNIQEQINALTARIQAIEEGQKSPVESI